MGIGTILLWVLGIVVGSFIIGVPLVWVGLQIQKARDKALAQKEYFRINNIPVAEKKPLFKRVWNFLFNFKNLGKKDNNDRKNIAGVGSGQQEASGPANP